MQKIVTKQFLEKVIGLVNEPTEVYFDAECIDSWKAIYIKNKYDGMPAVLHISQAYSHHFEEQFHNDIDKEDGVISTEEVILEKNNSNPIFAVVISNGPWCDDEPFHAVRSEHAEFYIRYQNELLGLLESLGVTEFPLNPEMFEFLED